MYFLLSTGISERKRASNGLLTEGDPAWTAAVQQLAWEKDLNLSATAKSLQHNNSGPTPLDEVNTPPDCGELTVTGPPTECTTVSNTG